MPHSSSSFFLDYSSIFFLLSSWMLDRRGSLEQEQGVGAGTETGTNLKTKNRICIIISMNCPPSSGMEGILILLQVIYGFN